MKIKNKFNALLNFKDKMYFFRHIPRTSDSLLHNTRQRTTLLSLFVSWLIMDVAQLFAWIPYTISNQYVPFWIYPPEKLPWIVTFIISVIIFSKLYFVFSNLLYVIKAFVSILQNWHVFKNYKRNLLFPWNLSNRVV